MKTIYIAGPMRSIPRFNFPAFDAAKKDIEGMGFVPVSPADFDREIGFDPFMLSESHDWNDCNIPGFDMATAIQRDIQAVKDCDGIYMLEGWEKSVGATAEHALAKWYGKQIIYQSERDVLHEAFGLTTGDRNASYGPPDQDFQRTAEMWSALKGVKFEAKEVAMFMICLKLSREKHQKKRDNWVDIAGYARCGSICNA